MTDTVEALTQSAQQEKDVAFASVRKSSPTTDSSV